MFADHFVALILDNEVTVGEFVTDPPLPWVRLIQRGGAFQVADGYPTVLTAAQAQFEMRNWDSVSSTAIANLLDDASHAANYVLLGNNAGQGFPLAQHVPQSSIANGAAIIYASSLPESDAYKRIGYRTFWRRNEAISRLSELARQANRPLALRFVNTIQHNTSNYHDP